MSTRLEEDGWQRIGRYCPDRRRSVWVRLVRDEAAISEEQQELGVFFASHETVSAIEIIGGREGADEYFRFERDGRVLDEHGRTCEPYSSLLDVVLTALYAAKLTEEQKERSE